MNRPFNNKLLSSDLYDYNSNYLERTKTELNFESKYLINQNQGLFHFKLLLCLELNSEKST